MNVLCHKVLLVLDSFLFRKEYINDLKTAQFSIHSLFNKSSFSSNVSMYISTGVAGFVPMFPNLSKERN